MRGPRGAELRAAAAAAFLLLVACVEGETPRELTSPAAEEQAPPAAEELAPNGREPLPEIFTGGQPSPEQLAAMRDAGFDTVINLRTPGEPGSEGEAELVASLGMRYVSIPVAGAEGMTVANARALAEALETAGRPVMVHCASGNRVGGLFALKSRFLDGDPADEAMAIGLAAGLTRLEPVVRERLQGGSAGNGP